MSLLTIAIEKWMSEVKIDLVKNYDKKGFRASGDFERQLESVVTETKATLYGAKQSYWMENGRFPNKDKWATPEGLAKFARWAGSTFIKKWMADKGIFGNPYKMAYAIGKKGYSVAKRPNVISEVISEKKINELRSMIGEYFLNKVKSDIISIKK